MNRSAGLGRWTPRHFQDTKKKELVGNYENAGRQWRKAKSPQHVNGHDLPDPSALRAYPYGIYDLGRNAGFVNVGTDHEPGALAVASIRGWWRFEGRRRYPVGRKVSDEELATINLKPHDFHGEWNYTIRPRSARHL